MSKNLPSFYAIIPANVRYCKNLEPSAKLLYGEITALCNQEGFCWATNNYFAKLYDVDVRTIKRWIGALVENEFIISQVDREGIQTTRRLFINTPEFQKYFMGGQNCHAMGDKKVLQVGDNIVLHNNTYLNNTKNNSSSLKVSSEEQAAGAAEEKLDCVDKPKKKAKKEFSPQVLEISAKMLEILKSNNPVYRPPEILDAFHEAVNQMVTIERQDPELLLRTFEWACSDNEQRNDFKGWQSIICMNKRGKKVTNPAEIFKGHFSSIFSQMNSKPKRKFLPCSDDDRAYKTMMEGVSRAL